MNISRLWFGLLGATMLAAQASADPGDISVFRLLRIEEYKSRASVDSSLATNNKHVANLVFQRVDSGNPDPPPDHSDYVLHGYKFKVITSGVEVGTSPTPTSGTPLTLIPNPGQTFEVHLVPSGNSFVVSGCNLELEIEDDWSWQKWDSQAGQWYQSNSGTQVHHVTYLVSKDLCHDASIDSRTAYGQPNTEGVLPGDPNADARNVNFGAWVWKGGLFAGNAPWTSGDQSGIARIQLYPQGTVGSPSCLVLTDVGVSDKFSGAMTVGAYVPGTGDPNLNTTESTVTWANKWAISPSPGNAISSVTLSGTVSTPDYLMWPLRYYGSQTIPSIAGVCLAMNTETTTNVWHYLASREYQGLFPTATDIMSDCQPRIWSVGAATDTITGPDPQPYP